VTSGGAVHAALRLRGLTLEWATLSWNVIGVLVLLGTALTAHSVALGAFGLDSLLEIGASTVVIWELSESSERRQEMGLRIIGLAFAVLALYLAVQSVLALTGNWEAQTSPLGIVWTAVTAVVMFALARGKSITGQALGNPVLIAEARVTVVDACLACVVLLGLVCNAILGWWWADPIAGLVIAGYAVREARHAWATTS